MSLHPLKPLLLMLCLAGCGQTGPLYLPEKSAPPPAAPPPPPPAEQPARDRPE